MGKVGGGVPESGSQLEIFGVCCYNGYAWAQNYDKMGEAFWKGKHKLGREVALSSQKFEKNYWNHWVAAVECPRVVLPCSHNIGTIGGSIDANLVPHPKIRKGWLFFPPNCWVRGYENKKCIHERQNSSYTSKRSKGIKPNNGSFIRPRLSKSWTMFSPTIEKTKNCCDFG